MKKIYARIVPVLIALTFLFTPAVISAASGDTTVYRTRTGECYHKEGCSHLRRSSIELTLQEAFDKGLRPCSKCKPPVLSESSTQKVTTKTAPGAADKSSSSGQKDATYILNKNSHKFHRPSCSSVDSMKESNKIYSSDSREAIIADGYSPCKRCKP